MKNKFFDKSIYQGRRQQILSLVSDGLILLPSNEEAGMNYLDNTYPFRQDSSFLFFCGIDRPGLLLLLDGTTGETLLVGEESSLDDIVWTGPVDSLKELAARAGIERVISQEEAQKWIPNFGTIHFLPVYRGDQAIRLSKIIGIPVDSIYSGASESLIQAVVSLREIKSAPEIDQLTEAINITGKMQIVMMKIAKSGMTEAEVMAAVRSTCLREDVDIAYPIILSVNGQTLHNHAYHNVLQPGQLLLGDFGAESPMHYAGDITRTIPVSAHFSIVQKDIYSLVQFTLNAATLAIKSGIKYLDVHLAAATNIASGMKDLGFLKGDISSIVEQGAHALFFPHGLGHALGLDVHDMENLGERFTGYERGMERSRQFGLKSLRLAKTLKTGMVLTVEPGIYFIPELIAIWKKENKFSDYINYDKIEEVLPFGGIRIEDNILVGPDGATILGDPIPKEIAEIENLRRQAYAL
ncbi:MAG: Xaa-Pro aminopeptidase [Saprospiraceae bacterium]|nr:Xaa-Pro aminopeptidase [Saprospiraceae bacterium]